MKISKLQFTVVILLLLLLLTLGTAGAQEQPKVRAILFYSPTCPHCHKVITEDLPPLFDQYGDQLIILGVDVSTQSGSEFFRTTIEQIEYPQEQVGVPFLLIADTYMVGADQIPAELPPLIAESLKADGIAWPDIPAVQEFLFTQGFIDENGQDILPTPQAEPVEEEPATKTADPTDTPQDTPQPTKTEVVPTQTSPPANDTQQTDSGITVLTEDTTPTDTGSVADRFNRDKIANGIAVVVLVVMIGVVIWIGIQFMQAATPKPWPDWIMPVLLVVGFAIAVYLGLIEVTGDEAICGPVGDCNAVQQSKYSKLFGVIPVAVLGMVGYVSIGASWLVSRRTDGKTQFYAQIAMFLFALFGLLFFIYLTFLEPFVIGATCAWCISSAIIMTLINLYATPIVLNAWAETDLADDLEEED